MWASNVNETEYTKRRLTPNDSISKTEPRFHFCNKTAATVGPGMQMQAEKRLSRLGMALA